jgi:DNA-binding NarL/FixJ family response regulator
VREKTFDELKIEIQEVEIRLINLRKQALAALRKGRIAILNVDLSRRQQEVMKLIECGRTNKEIASELSICERTVKFHVSQILQKCRAENRYQLRGIAQLGETIH